MKKKKPLGKPLPKIADDYVDPIPTSADVDALVAQWDIYAPTRYKGLLAAKNKSVIKETGEEPGPFIFDDDIKRFVEVKTGRILSRMEVRNAYMQFVQNYARR